MSSEKRFTERVQFWRMLARHVRKVKGADGDFRLQEILESLLSVLLFPYLENLLSSNLQLLVNVIRLISRRIFALTTRSACSAECLARLANWDSGRGVLRSLCFWVM